MRHLQWINKKINYDSLFSPTTVTFTLLGLGFLIFLFFISYVSLIYISRHFQIRSSPCFHHIFYSSNFLWAHSLSDPRLFIGMIDRLSTRWRQLFCNTYCTLVELFLFQPTRVRFLIFLSLAHDADYFKLKTKQSIVIASHFVQREGLNSHNYW